MFLVCVCLVYGINININKHVHHDHPVGREKKSVLTPFPPPPYRLLDPERKHPTRKKDYKTLTFAVPRVSSPHDVRDRVGARPRSPFTDGHPPARRNGRTDDGRTMRGSGARRTTGRVALAAALMVAAALVRPAVSDDAALLYLTNGAAAISQDCIPRRQRQVDVTEVSLVCDHQASYSSSSYGDGSDGDQNGSDDQGDHDDDYSYRDVSYANKATCLAGDLGKVAIGCTWR